MARKPVIAVEVDQEFKDKVIAIAKRKGVKMVQYAKWVLYEAVEKELAA